MDIERLGRIRELHIEIEQALQRITQAAALPHCAACTAVCCKEPLCRESIDSAFLRFVLGDRAEDYDPENGWLEPGKGCRLTFGRPSICYEFFCSKFSTEEIKRSHADLAKDFRQVYANAHQRRHILEIDDLSAISTARLDKMIRALEELRERTIEALDIALVS